MGYRCRGGGGARRDGLRGAPLAAVAAALVLLLPRTATAASLTAVQSASQLWEQTALNAAEATLTAIQKQTGRERVSLRSVPLESVKVFVGRQHLLSIELDGVEYKVRGCADVTAACAVAAANESRWV